VTGRHQERQVAEALNVVQSRMDGLQRQFRRVSFFTQVPQHDRPGRARLRFSAVRIQSAV